MRPGLCTSGQKATSSRGVFLFFFLTLKASALSPPGHPAGSAQASGGAGSGPREGGAGARLGARRPRQRTLPGDDGPRRQREPHGGGPPAPGAGHPGGHSGGEGGADAPLCGEDWVIHFMCLDKHRSKYTLSFCF